MSDDGKPRLLEPKDSVWVKNSIKLDSTLVQYTIHRHSTPQFQHPTGSNGGSKRAKSYDEPADKGEGVVANSRGDDVLPIAELNAREDVDIWNKNSEMEDEMFREVAGVKSMLSKREVQGRYN
ncbi:hypothetical protein C8R44DRAFT_749706 [Mycena epipterygia]|nr:hypothetical protein C8R44DRAFT_749706 [Mycena epipterygia]